MTRLGGTVKIKSEMGHGTTFDIEIPKTYDLKKVKVA